MSDPTPRPERVTLTDEDSAALDAHLHRWWRDGAGVMATPSQHIARLMAVVEPEIERILREAKAEAWDEGRRAERRDWEFTFDLSTRDEDRQPWPNPYRDQAEEPT